MSGGKLFHKRALAMAEVRSPTIAHCDWRTYKPMVVSCFELNFVSFWEVNWFVSNYG